jgi:hypothetical protein
VSRPTVLSNQRLQVLDLALHGYAEVEADVEVGSARDFTLKGFRKPITAFNVVAVREPAGDVSTVASS